MANWTRLHCRRLCVAQCHICGKEIGERCTWTFCGQPCTMARCKACVTIEDPANFQHHIQMNPFMWSTTTHRRLPAGKSWQRCYRIRESNPRSPSPPLSSSSSSSSHVSGWLSIKVSPISLKMLQTFIDWYWISPNGLYHPLCVTCKPAIVSEAWFAALATGVLNVHLAIVCFCTPLCGLHRLTTHYHPTTMDDTFNLD